MHRQISPTTLRTRERDTMNRTIRPAHHDELKSLSELCLRSKAIHGYDAAFMQACRDELTLTPGDLDEARLAVADAASGTVAGVVQISMDDEGCYLEKLFVAPEHMGQGFGRTLFQWAVHAALALGADAMIIESDPDAAPFYKAMGAQPAGQARSMSIPGRLLPRLVSP
ncbi:MAG: GNAT family N-acetyltransferase [Myxococcota bacterium]